MLPSYLHHWTEPYTSLAGKRVLDFGCGEGTSAAGIAWLQGATVHGVDINNEAEACRTFLKQSLNLDQPDTLTFQEIAPGGEINGTDFDCIFSWSVFEHVANRIYDSVLKDLYSRLKPGGLFFMQISPLYFSPEGHHLWALNYNSWEHLLNQTSEVYDDLANSELSDPEKEHLRAMYDTLNRVTADDVVQRFLAAGFELLKQSRDTIDIVPPETLLRSYTKEALTTFQIVALFRRPL